MALDGGFPIAWSHSVAKLAQDDSRMSQNEGRIGGEGRGGLILGRFYSS